MLEQPLPERIAFIHGFLQSKTLRWCWGKPLPLLDAPDLWGSLISCLQLPPPESDPPLHPHPLPAAFPQQPVEGKAS